MELFSPQANLLFEVDHNASRNNTNLCSQNKKTKTHNFVKPPVTSKKNLIEKKYALNHRRHFRTKKKGISSERTKSQDI